MDNTAVDAARFYKDLKEEAWKEIMESIHINDNEVACLSVVVREDLLSFQNVITTKIKLNGHTETSEVKVPKGNPSGDFSILEGAVDLILEELKTPIKRRLMSAQFKGEL